jgi:hypothetical protein
MAQTTRIQKASPEPGKQLVVSKGPPANGREGLLTLPERFQAAFHDLDDTLRRLARDQFLGLTAFGGWLHGDPFFSNVAARSVAVLDPLNIAVLEQLAVEGPRFGEQGLAAPLVMTPAYIRDSCDTFPLELLEIQQQHLLISGRDFFSGVKLEATCVRLACERELKSELIQLHQGLLASGGRFALLHDFCLDCLERSARIMRGLLFLHDGQAGLTLADTISRVQELARVDLGTHHRLATVKDEIGVEGFRRFYHELEALAAHANALPH